MAERTPSCPSPDGPTSVADLVQRIRALLASLPTGSSVGAADLARLREAADLFRQAVARVDDAPPIGRPSADASPGQPGPGPATSR